MGCIAQFDFVVCCHCSRYRYGRSRNPFIRVCVRSIYILCVHASSSSCCCYSLPFSYFFSSRPTPVRRRNLSTEWHTSYEHKYTIILFGEWKCFDVFIKLLHLHGLLSLYSLHTRRAIVQVEEGTRRQQSQQQQPAIEIVRTPNRLALFIQMYKIVIVSMDSVMRNADLYLTWESNSLNICI